MKRLIFPLVFSLFFPLVLSCGGDNSQFTKKLAASPFVSELFGESTKVLAIQSEAGSHISWMGLDWSDDYKFFEVEKISVNGVITEPEAEGPTAVLSDITVGLAPNTSGTAGTPNNGQLLIKIKYNPLEAIEADDHPHKAYLLLAFDKPEVGTVRIELNGYTRGICEACHTNVGESLVYEAKDGDGDGNPDFEFYLCDAQAIPADQQTPGPLPDGTDPETPYNLAVINLTGTVNALPVPTDFNFYPDPDDENNLVISGGDDTIVSTIPEFEIPVPGGKPVPAVPVAMVKNKQVKCTLDSNKGIDCEGIELSVMGGVVLVSGMHLTTGTVEAGNTECPGFGTWQGEGGFDGTSDVTLIATAEVLPSGPLVDPTNIPGALIVAVIKLQPKK